MSGLFSLVPDLLVSFDCGARGSNPRVRNFGEHDSK